MVNRSTSARVARSSDVDRLAADLGDWNAGSGPLFRRLARAMADTVERGTLAHGTRLPSERALATAIWVSRGTVVAAYDQLEADGVIERRHGSGTFVAASSPGGLPADREGSALLARLVGSGVTPVDLIDLSIAVLHDAPGLPDITIGTAELSASDDRDSPWGDPRLRRSVAALLTAQGLPTELDQVVITTGAQQAISAAAACWVRPGDRVVVEDPTYPGAIAAFRAAGADVAGVPVDRHGVDIEALADVVADRPALVYLQSAGHNPTGMVMAESRRRAVAGLMAAARVPLVEDVALSGLTWASSPSRRPVPPIVAHIPDHPSAVVGSFSKVFWSGLRVGFARAPRPVAGRLARVKATQDLGSSSAGQTLAARLLDHPDTPRFLATRNAVLRARADHLMAELGRELPTWTWDQPLGGLSLWVRLPIPDAHRFAHAALARGVAVATSEGLSASGAHPDRIRLSFAAPEAVLTEAVRRLATV